MIVSKGSKIGNNKSGNIKIKVLRIISMRKSKKNIFSVSPEQTIKTGLQLGKKLVNGDVVCLQGELGTGKTAFVKGVAKAQGINDHITSPTFTIVNEYEGDKILYHFDVYRLNDEQELYDIGFEEYLYGEGIVIIEWADIVRKAIPEENIWVTIRKDLAAGVNKRFIDIEFNGARYQKALFEQCFN